MTQIICSKCKRSYESGVQFASGSKISHSYCARCTFLMYEDLYDDPEGIGEIKSLIAKEIADGTIWDGEDKSEFKPEQQTKFDNLLREVQAERGEGHIDKR
ncbi:MAG: hypothetical protein HY979_01650 [Candidatus Magasanikbacteria bacterium]|nr:hypothetical protein [Candidatus Magasanikbacteria bacterium]